MPNHWHFLLCQVGDDDLFTFMQRLSNTHAQRWQHHCHRVGHGHVYQGRFKSFPVEEDEYDYQVLRKIERNALRAALLERAEDWRWSSLSSWRSSAPDETWPLARPLGATLKKRRRTEAAGVIDTFRGRTRSLECGAHGAALKKRQRTEAASRYRNIPRADSLFGVRRPRRRFGKTSANRSRFAVPQHSAGGLALWSAAPTAPLWKNVSEPKPLRGTATFGGRTRSLECGAHGAALEKRQRTEAASRHRNVLRANPYFGVRRPRRRFGKTSANRSRFAVPQHSAGGLALWSAAPTAPL
jgi:hypothetical protein